MNSVDLKSFGLTFSSELRSLIDPAKENEIEKEGISIDLAPS